MSFKNGGSFFTLFLIACALSAGVSATCCSDDSPANSDASTSVDSVTDTAEDTPNTLDTAQDTPNTLDTGEASTDSVEANPTGRLRYEIEAAELEFLGEGDLRIPAIDGFDRMAQPGAPNLPVRVVDILLPPGAILESCGVTAEERSELPGEYTIPSVPTPYTDDGTDEDGLYDVIDDNDQELADATHDQIYGSNELFPREVGECIERGQWRGWSHVLIEIHPLQYQPQDGRLFHTERMTLDLSIFRNEEAERDLAQYLETRSMTEFLLLHFDNGLLLFEDLLEEGRWKDLGDRLSGRGSETLFERRQDAEGLIDRLDQRFSRHERTGPRFIIITSASVYAASQTAIDEFLAVKQAEFEETGGAHLITVEEIGEMAEGVGDPEAIRDYLRSVNEPPLDTNLEYVLLIGTSDTVPMKKIYYDRLQHDEAYTLLTDRYYADLENDWDADGDGHPGEYADDTQPAQPNGIDYWSNIAVGRIPFDDSTSIGTVLQRTMDYIDATQDAAQTEDSSGLLYRAGVLFGGAALSWNTDETCEAGCTVPDSCTSDQRCTIKTDAAHWTEYVIENQLDEREDVHRLYTAGLQPSDFYAPEDTAISRLTSEDFAAEWNTGQYGLVIAAGHGNPHSVVGAELTGYCDYGTPTCMHQRVNVTTQSTLAGLTTENPAFVMAIACATAEPISGTNLIQTILIQNAVGVIAASFSTKYYNWETAYDTGVPGCDSHGLASDQLYHFLYGTYTGGWSVSFGTSLYATRCDPDGNHRSWHINSMATNYFGDPSVELAIACAEDEWGCNGIDDDCDGEVDEGCRRFP